MTVRGELQDIGVDDDGRLAFADDEQTVSVTEAARLLGRDRTRVANFG